MHIHYSVALLALAPLALGALAARADKPEHAVIFLIDGLSYKALERLPMKNLRALIAAGALCEKSYNIVPAHPRTGEWAKYNTSSIPNPAILAGTLLLRPDQQYVQHSFFPLRTTAHAANDCDYQRLNVGFHLTFMRGNDEHQVHDNETIYWALEFLRQAKPAFMKVHLQDTGNAGARSAEEKDTSVPWRQNIWAEGSPYRKAAVQADEYLGRFVDELNKLGLRDKTVLFVSADHGQSDRGAHPFDDQDGWVMPLVLSGPGIRAGARLDYAEQIDIVPTLCYLMGVKPPANADGRILAEALVSPPAHVPPRRHDVRELNALLLRGEALVANVRQEAGKSPSARAKLSEAERDFYSFDRILQWRKFGSLEKLIQHDRAVLDKLEH